MTTKSSMKSQTSLPMKRYSSSMAENPHLIEFPTSPQPAAVGEEITHYSHSKHPLTEVTLNELFTCSGCKEYGAGKRFSCQECEFQLHEFCAFAPPLLKNHQLHGQHQLVFHSKPKPAKAGISWPRCNICGKSTKGFAFRCRACSFQMHPCCAMLSTEINFPPHPHLLRLLPPLSTNNDLACGECNKRRPGRMYHCTVCDYHLHAACAKALYNGLRETGIPLPDPRPNAIEKAARLASQVVIEFIGGLIEGLGEGMGGALIDNIARGRCISRRRMQE
ncbi:Diacylglycerol kinase [Handroanthus impetiginosus]|uniref:Diacylglycerol kinase n=1 Tax=Handroanthus impetiginosus TaxID=429701 RepID=A0A2G9FWV5_9LAMI|nr:Diacylglycerol kinase [Handroanthus impetiginosus]